MDKRPSPTRPLAILISGSRHAVLDDHGVIVRDRMEHAVGKRRGVLIIHGAADGIDGIADYIAHRRGWHTLPMYAQWDDHGRQAGPLRNQAMVDVALRLHQTGWDVQPIAFPASNAPSTGTNDLIRRSTSFGLGPTVIPIEVTR